MCICKRKVNCRPIVAGETWHAAVVYGSQRFNARNVAGRGNRLMSGGAFKGMKVVTTFDGRQQTQYILLQGNPKGTFDDEETSITFTGHFGVVSVDHDGEPRELYIGDGERLTFGTTVLTTPEGTQAAYWRQSEIR